MIRKLKVYLFSCIYHMLPDQLWLSVFSCILILDFLIPSILPWFPWLLHSLVFIPLSSFPRLHSLVFIPLSSFPWLHSLVFIPFSSSFLYFKYSKSVGTGNFSTKFHILASTTSIESSSTSKTLTFLPKRKTSKNFSLTWAWKSTFS